MAIQIISTNTANANHGVKALVYGRSSAGKTYLARTAPAPIILSAESGLLSLRDVNLPVIEIKSVQALSEVYQWLLQSHEARQFHTVYIDSISEIAEVILSNAKKLTKDPRQAYGELLEKTIASLRDYRDLPYKHVVMVAKQELVTDEITKVTMYGPSMPGSKLSPALPYMFDEVFRLAIGTTPEGKTYRYLQTQPDLQHDAKDRSGALDPIEQPDLTHIFNKILGVR